MYSRLALLCLLLTAGALAQQAAPAEGPTSIPSLAPLLAPASAPAGAAVAALASFPSLAVPSSAPPTETPVEAPAPTASVGPFSESFRSMADQLQLLLSWPQQFRRIDLSVSWVSYSALQSLLLHSKWACLSLLLTQNLGCMFNNPTQLLYVHQPG